MLGSAQPVRPVSVSCSSARRFQAPANLGLCFDGYLCSIRVTSTSRWQRSLPPTLQVWETGAWGHATWDRPQASALCGAQWAADGGSLLLPYSSARVVQLTFVDEAPSLEGVLAPAQLPDLDVSGAGRPKGPV